MARRQAVREGEVGRELGREAGTQVCMDYWRLRVSQVGRYVGSHAGREGGN